MIFPKRVSLRVYARVCFCLGTSKRLVIFDDELPAVSALSRSDLKMAERPNAKLRCNVGVEYAQTKKSRSYSYPFRSTAELTETTSMLPG